MTQQMVKLLMFQTKGITAIELEDPGSGTIRCGSYGIIISSDNGKIATALSAENSITSNSRGVLISVNTVAGYCGNIITKFIN